MFDKQRLLCGCRVSQVKKISGNSSLAGIGSFLMQISIINTDFSYKRVLATLFSELLLCVKFVKKKKKKEKGAYAKEAYWGGGAYHVALQSAAGRGRVVIIETTMPHV